MLGNDIVDLTLAKHQTRWHTATFQEKVLHPVETEKFKNNALGFTAFWKIWSIKESVYKAHQREKNHLPKFNPFHFLVEEISENKSRVCVEGLQYEVLSYISSNLIYSFTKGENVHSFQNFEIAAKNSSFIPDLKRSDVNLKLSKNQNGIPFLNQQNKSVPISLTHHGKYFACLY